LSLCNDLNTEVVNIFRTKWQIREGQTVPEPKDIQLGNDAVEMKATVLYADLAESTGLVDTYKDYFAAEIYKSFLHCASKIIRNEGGEITAFDGDRVMAVFIGNSANTSSVRCALKINYVVEKIINPSIKSEYPNTSYSIQYAVGIDTSSLFIARTGIRGSNDLVWVGHAANHAAKLCALREGNYTTWITEEVYDKLNDTAKYSDNHEAMWERRTLNSNGKTVYRSSWWWKID